MPIRFAGKLERAAQATANVAEEAANGAVGVRAGGDLAAGGGGVHGEDLMSAPGINPISFSNMQNKAV
jgi:hypothetical protein